MWILKNFIPVVLIFSTLIFWGGCDTSESPTSIQRDSLFVFDTMFVYDTTHRTDTIYSKDTLEIVKDSLITRDTQYIALDTNFKQNKVIYEFPDTNVWYLPDADTGIVTTFFECIDDGGYDFHVKAVLYNNLGFDIEDLKVNATFFEPGDTTLIGGVTLNAFSPYPDNKAGINTIIKNGWRCIIDTDYFEPESVEGPYFSGINWGAVSCNKADYFNEIINGDAIIELSFDYTKL